MAQHITSIPELLASQEQGLTPDAGDIVFVVRGSGTYRDIVFSLAQLREFFTTNPDMFKVGTSEWKNVQGTGPTMGGLAALSAGVIEALTRFVVGGSKWEPGNGRPTITGLYGVEAGNVGTTNLQADTIDSHGEGVTALQVLKKLVGNQGQSAQSNALALGATRADSLVVDGDAEVSGDLTVDGDLSIVGAFVADGGFATNNGDIKSTNGEVSGSTVTATNKLTLGTALRFTINDSSGHGVGDAETWVANTAPQDSLLCVINDNNDSVVMWDGEGRQTFIMGHSALLIMKIGAGVYPVTAQLNYS